MIGIRTIGFLLFERGCQKGIMIWNEGSVQDIKKLLYSKWKMAVLLVEY